MTVDIDLSKTWHHSTETTLDKYLFQQEKWLLIVICYGNLSSAVLVVNKLAITYFSLLRSRLMLDLGYKYKQEVSNKPCDWNIECKRQKLISTISNRIRSLCL